MVTNHLKHSVSVIKTNQLILYTEMSFIWTEIQTKCINEIREQNVEFFLIFNLMVHKLIIGV